MATGAGKEPYGFYYPKPSSFQQQSKGYLRALVFVEVIISAGFSPRPFFSPFSSLFLFFFFGGVQIPQPKPCRYWRAALADLHRHSQRGFGATMPHIHSLSKYQQLFPKANLCRHPIEQFSPLTAWLLAGLTELFPNPPSVPVSCLGVPGGCGEGHTAPGLSRVLAHPDPACTQFQLLAAHHGAAQPPPEFRQQLRSHNLLS